MKTLLIFSMLIFSCEDSALRDHSRPSDEGDQVPGYLEEIIQSVSAFEKISIDIGKTTLSIPENTLNKDAEVRLRTLDALPSRPEVAFLGEAKGDILEVTMYEKESEETYSSSLLDQAYAVSQELHDISDAANLKYVIISAPDTPNEKVEILSRNAIAPSQSLSTAELTVTIELRLTHAIIYAVESEEKLSKVVVLDSGSETSNDGGGSVNSTNPYAGIPSLSHVSTTYGGEQTITLTTSTPGATIRYTTDGSEPSETNGIDYSGPIAVSSTQTIKAIAIKTDYNNSAIASATIGISALDCSTLPGGKWVLVPADPVVNQDKDFCVMKYEAQGETAAANPGGESSSRISRDEATARCAALGSGSKLITNPMWQALARNIETAQSPTGLYRNWSKGSIGGSNSLNIGNATGGLSYTGGLNYSGAIPSADDTEGCYGASPSDISDTCNGDWHLGKRTHTLSNNEVIWDVSGGFWEWVSNVPLVDEVEGRFAQIELNNLLKLGPTHNYGSGGNYEKTVAPYGGLGGVLGTSAGAVLRGGQYAQGQHESSFSGIFNALLGYSSTYGAPGFGYRCAIEAP